MGNYLPEIESPDKQDFKLTLNIDEITRLVDDDTVLLSVNYVSNILGTKLDIEPIVAAAKAIKPDLYIVVDVV